MGEKGGNEEAGETGEEGEGGNGYVIAGLTRNPMK